MTASLARAAAAADAVGKGLRPRVGAPLSDAERERAWMLEEELRGRVGRNGVPVVATHGQSNAPPAAPRRAAW